MNLSKMRFPLTPPSEQVAERLLSSIYSLVEFRMWLKRIQNWLEIFLLTEKLVTMMDFGEYLLTFYRFARLCLLLEISIYFFNSLLKDDRMYAHLTVFETLILAAHFYLPDTFTTEAKVELVNDVIDELGLGKTRDTIIGDEKKRGISGGERKRANIAAQLISDPAVLFLDEPTSGLDSFQALAVMDSMKTLAANGRLVVTVIHQPRSSIYDMFDKLLLLSESHAIYLGPARDACAYFEGMGHVCPQFFNPADFFLDILSPDVRTPEREQTTQKRIADFAEVWLSAAAQRNIRTNSEIQKDTTLGEIKQTGTFSAGKFSRNILLLGWRSFSEQRRNIGAIMFKTIMSIIFACIIGGIYSGNSNDLSSIRNKYFLI